MKAIHNSRALRRYPQLIANHLLRYIFESYSQLGIHKNADRRDLAHNTSIGETLGKNGYAVEIREHLEDSTPNPELMINGVLSDVKSPKLAYSLDSRLQSAINRQGLNNVVFEVTKRESVDALTKGLKRGFHNRSKIEWVDVVFGETAVRITRAMYERGVISKELQKLYK